MPHKLEKINVAIGLSAWCERAGVLPDWQNPPGRLVAQTTFLVVTVILLVACTQQPAKQDTTAFEPPVSNIDTARNALEQTNEAEVEAPTEGVQAKVFPGTDRNFKKPASRKPIRLDGEAVMLNFEQAPLAEVVHSILGDTLGLDYVVEHPISGEVTVRTRSPVPRDQLLPILESLLRNNNVLMVRGPNDRFFVSGSPSMRSTVPRFDTDPSTGFSHIIVPLQYIGAVEMAEILGPVAPEDSFVRIDQSRNLLILAGTQLQLEGWLDIVSTFDVDQLADKSVGIFPLENSTVGEVFAELQHIISAGEGAGLGGLVRIMPVDRLNSILVVSPRLSYVNAIRDWVEKLDSVADPAAEPTLHVYPVKNGNAGQLASLLSTIYGGGTGGAGASTPASVAPGLNSARSSSSAGSGVGGSSGMDGGASMPATGSGNKPRGGTFQLGDNVRVVADNFNNALLVYAPASEYRRIERTLTKLDVVATQVLIEASIIEVTLSDDLEYGLEWAFDNNFGGGDIGAGLLDLGSGEGIGRRIPGFSYTITNSAGAVKAVLNALAEKSMINVISTPSVMVLDNHTAAIHVGDQQPIQGQQTVTNGGNVQTSITYKDTGVKLQVTPSVNDGGLVTMDISQSVTDVGPVDAATRQRSFLERNVSSRVAVRTGESVVLGGLIRDNEASGRSGIPLLMDIPVLGNLFSSNTQAGVRTELLVFITPRVLESDNDLRELNREMRQRMRGLTNFDDLPVGFKSADGE